MPLLLFTKPKKNITILIRLHAGGDNVRDKLIKFMNSLKEKLIDEKEREHLQFLCIFVVLAIISLGMSIVNLVVDSRPLLYFSLAFFVLNVLDIVLACLSPMMEAVSRVLFFFEILWLLTYFVITGSAEGFSAIWSCLLPVGALLLYRRKQGTLLSGIMFAILVFFFWTPFGKPLLQYDYSPVFMLRFPMLYAASFCIGFLLETVRAHTQERLAESNRRYRILSYTDMLTGLGNETLYVRTVDRLERLIHRGHATFAIAVMDVNGVKSTNDQYGHRYGCHLIVTAGKKLPEIFPHSRLFHIGGDEFVAILTGEDYRQIETRIEAFREALSCKTISFENTELTLSVAIGYAFHKEGESYSDTFQRADKQMYKNKRAMKDQYGIAMR